MQLLGQQAGAQAGALAGGQAAVQAAINGYLNIDPALMRQIAQHVQRPPPNATAAQQLAAIQSLFNVLRTGGTLGLTWQDGAGRQPRSPSEALRARGGDCDELSTLFYAAARQLGIDVSGFRLATMTFASGGATVAHAPLLLELGGARYIVDPIMPRIIGGLADFNNPTLIARLGPFFYPAMPGNPPPGPVTIRDRRDFSTPADIASVELLERAIHNSLLNTAAGTAAAGRDLAAVVAIGSGSAFVAAQRDIAAQNIYNFYFNSAELAFNAGRRDAALVRMYEESLAIIRQVPSISGANEASVYRTRGALGICHRVAGRHARARAEFQEQIRLRPRDPAGHRNLIDLEARLGNYPAALAACDAALRQIPRGTQDYNDILAFRRRVAARVPGNP